MQSAENSLNESAIILSPYFMLPDTNHLPAACAQPTEVALVAVAVGAEFVAPEFRELVLPRRESPAVPKVAVHENGNALAGKNDVGTARQVANVTAEAKSFCPKFPLHQLFQRAVLEFHALHRA